MAVERIDYCTEHEFLEALQEEEYQELLEEEREERRRDEEMARWGDDYYPEGDNVESKEEMEDIETDLPF